ncbi:MAG: hypothetical protein IJP18_06815 [Oscillospiraceae bacterium]|nr:hypothetical protein [Oscillospiraceae bacterium]
MKPDVFLYSRTRTHDYIDMYIPSWLSNKSEAYNDYRKIISHIFKIRDILPENKCDILNSTADSFMFFKTDNICMLCRFCHKVGDDEFGRAIFSTEGFLCKGEDLIDFWYRIPDMLCYMLMSEEKFYDKYMLLTENEPKPTTKSVDIDVPEKLNPMVSYSLENDVQYVMSIKGILNQFQNFMMSASQKAVPFSFVLGTDDKELYTYDADNGLPPFEMFFTRNKCSTVSENEDWRKSFVPAKINTDAKKYYTFVELKKSEHSKLRYRLVIAREPKQEKTLTSVPFVSYEQESGGNEVDFRELVRMYETLAEGISELGYEKSKKEPYVFEKR